MKVFNIFVNSKTESNFNKDVNVLNETSIGEYTFPETEEMELTDIVNFKVINQDFTGDFKCLKISEKEGDGYKTTTYAGSLFHPDLGLKHFIFVYGSIGEERVSGCYLI